MTITSKPAVTRTKYHPDAYQFLFAALRHAQRKYNRVPADEAGEQEAHVTGRELLEGVRELALQQFGLLAAHVFDHWGIHVTADFGRMVFELIDRGEMKRTEQDQFGDFLDVYDFEDAFDRDYRIDTSRAFVW